MGIVYRIDKEKGISFALWHGVITADEFLTHAQRLLADPDWPAHRALHLSDLQTAHVDDSVDDAVLEKAASLFGSHPKLSNLKVAILAQEEFERAVSFERFFLRYRSSMIVFNSLETACIWLGIDLKVAALALQSLRAFLVGRDESAP